MPFCCVKGCSSKSTVKVLKEPNINGITFHKFPTAQKRRLQWISNVGLDHASLKKGTFICSLHFNPEMIDRTGQITRLKEYAVPTVFDIPGHQNVHSPEPHEVMPESPIPVKVNTNYHTREHSYVIKDSPKTVKRKLQQEIQVLKKKLKLCQHKLSYAKNKNKSFKSIIKNLKKNSLISNQFADFLQSSVGDIPNDLFLRMCNRKGGKYPQKIRAFAMTLHFYSAKAYKYVRKTLNMTLPHPSVLRKWYSSISGEPGFSNEVFNALKAKVLSGEKVICSLLMDEMAIRKHVQWDGKKFRGFVDLGTGAESSDSAPMAREAFVLMLVGLNSNWKVPCGYFLVNGLTGKEKANIISTCLLKLNDIGVSVNSLTCDGSSPNISMLTSLGAKIDSVVIPLISHPSDKSLKIPVFLDPCHMIKLIRNTLAELKQLKIEDKLIKWTYIKELHTIQEQEGLRLGNKLKSLHIHYQNHKMKVNLATQCLSSSVADAISYCRENLNIQNFQDSEPTVNFIKIFDRLFDIFNSRNPLAKGFKAPLRPSNYIYIDQFLNEAEQYIRLLKDNKDIPILESKRKTGFLGFLINIISLRFLVKKLLFSEPPIMKYFLTYKISQDHLELFFSAVRGAGGFNNNPTSTQFSAAYKKLFIRHEIEGGRGNCIPQDKTKILEICDEYENSSFNISTNIDPKDIPDIDVISEFKEAAISYIAGYVNIMMKKKIKCTICLEAISGENDPITPSLVNFKNKGGLQIPNGSVFTICTEAEKLLQRELKISTNKLLKSCNISSICTNTLLKCQSKSLFPTLDSHLFDTPPTSNHVVLLIKSCINCYLKIRMHHIEKIFNENISGEKIRKRYSKLVLFKHQ